MDKTDDIIYAEIVVPTVREQIENQLAHPEALDALPDDSVAVRISFDPDQDVVPFVKRAGSWLAAGVTLPYTSAELLLQYGPVVLLVDATLDGDVDHCRQCGCTDDLACITPDGQRCYWVDADLCSACAATLVDRISQVLDVHRWKTIGADTTECECGAILAGKPDPFPADEAFRRHIATCILASLPGRCAPTTDEIEETLIQASSTARVGDRLAAMTRAIHDLLAAQPTVAEAQAEALDSIAERLRALASSWMEHVDADLTEGTKPWTAVLMCAADVRRLIYQLDAETGGHMDRGDSDE